MKPFDVDCLKREIKLAKHEVYYCKNWDYVTGYLPAMSTVEGLIAILQEKAIVDDGKDDVMDGEQY